MNQNIVMSDWVQNVYIETEKTKYEVTSKHGVHSSTYDPIAFIRLLAVVSRSVSLPATVLGLGIGLPYQHPSEAPAAMMAEW